MRDSYNQLSERFRRILVLGDAEAVLRWDQSVMMPGGGASDRAEQVAVLETTQHGLLAAPDMEELLDSAATEDLDEWRTANLAGMRRMWVHAAALPEDLVAAKSHAASACEQIWRMARAEADFQQVLPSLRTLLNLTREGAAAKSEKLGVGLYDALLDEYEPDARSADIDLLFEDLGGFLPDFLSRVLERQAAEPPLLDLAGPFPVERQEALGRRLMSQLGFDFEHGRLDVSLHPFCGGTQGDVRLTTRYDPADFTSALMGVLHETGHALYEMGLPDAWRHQPVGGAMGMSIHESQSLLIEMQVCRSRDFLTYAAPVIADELGGGGPAWDIDNLTRIYTRVKPDFIRVDADEVTYPAHVILRYELEKALIQGSMDLADLPEAWNDGLERLLGIRPPNDGLGCLQDIHWYDGAWGYFPTYTLGAMTAAQLFAAAQQADTELLAAIAQGDFVPLMTWLRANVHGMGCSLSAPDLLRQATGEPLSTTAFKRHLEARYLPSA
ncbi:carboxypeptidase M32 [Magnetospira sp. QH-2]|uniref:carboxypeptidase M32 n=1 Tax=Magnetospira sp. (strain QH-2) TaxID=1288970 RepID=UPI0009E5E971|nr:carboxypeptidase M32 [Magnetospira sp. QH-2]